MQRLDDPMIRAQLVPHLRATHTPETVLVEELGLLRHQARVDVAAVNGALHGYEIKSDLDSLRRLTSQMEIYSRVLDRCTVVTGPRLLADALSAVPVWWGVALVSGEGSYRRLRSIRDAAENPDLEVRAQAELLWRDEALQLLDAHGAARGFRSKPREFVWDRLCEVCPAATVRQAVREHLRARSSRRVAPRPS